jgi:hypothetical protein
MARHQVPQVPPAIRAAEEALTTAEQRRQTLKRQHDDALRSGAERQFRRQGPTLYVAAGVIVEDAQVTTLRRQLDAATVAATAADREYRWRLKLHLVAS